LDEKFSALIEAPSSSIPTAPMREREMSRKGEAAAACFGLLP
jgi:hypothetical protein